MLRRRVVRKGLGAGPDPASIQSDARKDCWLAARGNDDVFSGKLNLFRGRADQDPGFACEARSAGVASDFVLLEKRINALCQSAHNLILAPQHRWQIEFDLRQFDAVLDKFFLCLQEKFARFEQRLARDTSDAQARSAQGWLLLD